ncbi:MAG: hypothetical protein ACI8QF_003163 [Limisphaerales bacterium]
MTGDFVGGRGRPIRFWAVISSFHQRTGDMDALYLLLLP